MLTDEQLRNLDLAAGWPASNSCLVPPAELRQLIAAARVANAMAREEREFLDAARRQSAPGEPEPPSLARARADLARALRTYTAHGPAEVAS